MLSLALSIISFSVAVPMNAPTYNSTLSSRFQTSYSDVVRNDSDDYLTFNYLIDIDCYINFNSINDYEVKIFNIGTSLSVIDSQTGNLLGSYEQTRSQDQYNYYLTSGSDITIYSQYDDSYSEISVYFDYVDTFHEVALFETPTGYQAPLYLIDNNQYDLSFYLGSTQYVPMLINQYYSTSGGSYDVGYQDGYSVGYNDGVQDGSSSGYQKGYNDGYEEGASQDETAVVIFSGIVSVALLPINMFLGFMNFEVFGINIGGLVSAFLTIAIVVIVIRLILGGKGAQ